MISFFMSFIHLSYRTHKKADDNARHKTKADATTRNLRRVDSETNVVNYKTRTKEADATKLQTTANFSTYL